MVSGGTNNSRTVMVLLLVLEWNLSVDASVWTLTTKSKLPK